MWKIGDLSLTGKVVLGPMSGYTSEAYRDFMRPFGVSVEYTEMISDQGCTHWNKATADFLRFTRRGPVGVQLFGSRPDDLALAGKRVLEINPDVDFLDINMGCPVPKVNRTGAGSALMKDPALCGSLVRSLKKTTGLPVTAKIRLGWTSASMNFREVIAELESAGADAVCIHPRTREERYAGLPHYDLIEDLGHDMSVPLIVSGNIYSLDDAIHAADISGASAVMVARGGIGNPYLITQIDRYFRDGTRLSNPTVSQQVDWCLQLADMLVDESGEETAVRRLRSIAPKFIAGCYRGKAFRNILATRTDSIDGLREMLEMVRSKIGDDISHGNGFRYPDERPSIDERGLPFGSKGFEKTRPGQSVMSIPSFSLSSL